MGTPPIDANTEEQVFKQVSADRLFAVTGKIDDVAEARDWSDRKRGVAKIVARRRLNDGDTIEQAVSAGIEWVEE